MTYLKWCYATHDSIFVMLCLCWHVSLCIGMIFNVSKLFSLKTGFIYGSIFCCLILKIQIEFWHFNVQSRSAWLQHQAPTSDLKILESLYSQHGLNQSHCSQTCSAPYPRQHVQSRMNFLIFSFPVQPKAHAWWAPKNCEINSVFKTFDFA